MSSLKISKIPHFFLKDAQWTIEGLAEMIENAHLFNKGEKDSIVLHTINYEE